MDQSLSFCTRLHWMNNCDLKCKDTTLYSDWILPVARSGGAFVAGLYKMLKETTQS